MQSWFKRSSYVAVAFAVAVGFSAARADDIVPAPPGANATSPPIVVDSTPHSVVESIPEPVVVDRETLSIGNVLPAVSLTTPRLLEGFKGSFDAGINGSEGNSRNLRIRVFTDGKREDERNVDTFNFLYNYGKDGPITSVNRAIFNGRREWKFQNSPYGFYSSLQLEYDQFRAFDFRLALFAGFSRTFIDNGTTLFKGRLGAGASREFGGPNDDWTPELNLGWDFNHKFNDRCQFKSTVDVYPDLGDLGQYRAQGSAFLETILDPTTNMIFRIGATDRYDSTPEGRKRNDIDYFASLGWIY